MDVTRRLTTLPASGQAIPSLRDGPMVQLASGVRFQRLSVNGAHVTDLQLQ
ncbi:MAG: hypothetical protein H7287_09255, partial [Thermoleophilia bacterium]|nr:hypothetical protein [Thermoleophilia bacterium]